MENRNWLNGRDIESRQNERDGIVASCLLESWERTDFDLLPWRRDSSNTCLTKLENELLRKSICNAVLFCNRRIQYAHACAQPPPL